MSDKIVTFQPRLTKPEAGNLYYIRKTNGGYNAGIKGKPTDGDCNVLANCVSYALGRFNEESEEGCCRFLAPVNPPIMPEYADGCDTGTEPKLGAVIIWRKGSGTAGHCGIVEQIIDNDTIVTSESHYGGAAFDINTRTRGESGTFEFKSSEGYTFMTFIYNPHLAATEPQTDDEGAKVKELTKQLDEAQKALKTAQDENEKLLVYKDNYEKLETALDKLQTKCDSYEQDVKELTALNADAKEELRKATESVTILNKDLDNLEQALIEAQQAAHEALITAQEQEERITILKKQTALKGDVNGDGKVDLSDVVYLLLHTINPDKYQIK